MKERTLSIVQKFLILLFLIGSIATAQTVRLGILTDFPLDERAEPFFAQLEEELGKTLGSRRTLILNRSDIVNLGWKYENAVSSYEALAKRCNLIILLGSGSIHKVYEQGNFPKPTIGLGVFDTEMQGIALTEDGTSGVGNFSYVLSAPNVASELIKFKAAFPYENLTLIFDRRFSPFFNQDLANQRVKGISSLLGTSVTRINMDDDLEATIRQIPAETDAVYISIPYGRTETEITKLADALKERKIPSFSMNRRDIDYGIMGCLSTDNDIPQILRKMSIMADEAMSGEPLSDLPVALNFREQLHLNRTTMTAIGVDPSFEVLFTAKFIGQEQITSNASYKFNDIIGWSLEENLNIKVSNLDVELAEQDIRNARSQLLPTIDASGSYSVINEEQAVFQAERTLTGALSLQQVLFSEQILAGAKVQAYLKKAEEAANRQTVLDILQNTFIGYFNVLQAKTNLAIQQENLDVSKTNLELAKLSVSLGASNRADIFRWESQVATAQQTVVEAYGQLALSQVQLDNFLNGKLGTDYDVEDMQIDSDIYQELSSSFIDDNISSPERFDRLLNFLVEEAKSASPSKMQLQQNMNATERLVSSNKRRYFLPTLALSGSGSNVFQRGGAGSTPAPGMEFQDVNWNLGVNLSIPLFEGNRRSIDLQTSKLQQRQLEYQLDNLDQNLRLLVTSSAIELLTAKTNIRFSRVAAENTQKNFELVQDYYRNGNVSVLDLIDAQEAALQAKQGYAISVYQYLTAYIGLENSIGRYGLLETEENNAALNARFKSFTTNQEGQK